MTRLSWHNEWIYALVIDRFHDGRVRQQRQHPERKGYGSYDDLRRSCGGTFNGIRQKLSYIHGLGCTSVLLTPFQENNPEFYHGYAIQDFLSVDARFGTLDELKALVHEAHELGLRVIMDVVLNHTGNNWSYLEKHTPFRKRKPYTFSHWHAPDKPQPLVLRNEAWYSRKGCIRHWDNYPESWDGDLFELKDLVWTKSKTGYEVMQCMVEIYTYWIKELSVDGFRLDALKHIRPVMANEFCRRIRQAASRLGKPDFLLIGEVIGNDALISKYEALDAYFNFPFYFDFLNNRKEGRPYDSFFRKTVTGLQPVHYLDNHDQIGLEPKKRISDLLTDEQVWGALLLMGLQPGISCLYYGTEQGLHTEGMHDHDVRECLFDPAGEHDWCDEQSECYRRTSEAIGWARKLKGECASFATEHKKELVILKGFGTAADQRFCVVVNLMPHPVMVDGIENLQYSNYTETESSYLKPFEVRIIV